MVADIQTGGRVRWEIPWSAMAVGLADNRNDLVANSPYLATVSPR